MKVILNQSKKSFTWGANSHLLEKLTCEMNVIGFQFIQVFKLIIYNISNELWKKNV